MRFDVMMQRGALSVILAALLLAPTAFLKPLSAEAAEDITIGGASGSNETRTVTGGDPPLEANVLTVGGRGTGTLTITYGGKVSAEGNILVGGGESTPGGIRGNGTVTVNGVGSELSSIGSIIIGDYGVGVLNITDGAKVSAAEVSLEPNASAYDSGTLLMGTGSELRVSGGGGKNLAVRNGLLAGSGTISLENGSNVTVNSGTISVGDHLGQIGELTILGGDLRNNVNMRLRVDTAKDGSADHITMSSMPPSSPPPAA